MTSLGGRVRELRQSLGLAQSDLARLSGLSNGYVSLVETGQRHPSPGALAGLARALQTTVDYLTDGGLAGSERAAEAAIAAASVLVDEGEPERAYAILAGFDPASVSQVHRLALLRTQGLALDLAGRSSEAIEPFEAALELAFAECDVTAMAEIGMWLVGAYLETGTLDRAVDVGNRIVARVEEAGATGSDEHLRLASTVLWALFERGDFLHAGHMANRLTRIAEELGSPRGRGSVYWNAALIAQGRRDDARALDLADRALTALIESGSDRDVARMRMDYGFMLLRTPQPRAAEALEHLSAALEELRRFGSKMEVARCLIEKARAHVLLRDLAAAEDLVTVGMVQLGGVVNLDACEARIVLGDIAMLKGDLITAERRYTWAAERLSMMSAGSRSATVLSALAGRMKAAGDFARAVETYRAALDALRVPSSSPVPRITQAALRRHAAAGERFGRSAAIA